MAWAGSSITSSDRPGNVCIKWAMVFGHVYSMEVLVGGHFDQQKQPTRCNLVIEFIIPKFIEG
jgi:hypothetical protein